MEMFDPYTCKVRWSFGLLTFVLLLADVRAQTPCSMASTITVTLDEGNVTANQALDSTSPYQASLPVTGTLGGPNGITLIMTSDNPLAPNPNNTFRIEDIGTGTRIRLITSVDRDGAGFTNLDDTEFISFQLKCTSNADTSTTAYATFNVNIRDVNDNSPQFTGTPYFLSVEELTPVGTTIYRQISASDKDSGLAATIDYILPAGDGSLTDGTRKFNFTSTRFPNLIISQSLDFEPMHALGQTTYVMNVIAKDLGTPPLSSVAQVNVTVTDSDDMAPAFVYASCLLSGIYCVDPRYSTSVVSGQITNPLIIYPLVGFTRQTATTIRAVDRDTLRSPLTFRIAGTSPVGFETYFSVAGSGPVSSGDKDVYTATLTQLQLITRSSTLTRVEVYILATQANLKYEERATVSVEIDVPNNSPPTVTTATGVNTGYIYENSRLGQNVLDGTTSSAKPLQLIVTDPDDSISGQKTTFSFSATGTGLFNVDSNGYIYLASGNLDYETTKSATINVRVTETNTAERRTTDVTVTILVLDLNDNDPVFTSTGAVHVSVPEGDYTLSSRLLAQVDATDADSGVNRILVYSIMSIEPTVPSGFFTINTNTGDVSLSGQVTYPSDYVVVVKASDSAVPPDTIRSATKNLYVNVTSAGNNAPQIPSILYTITISEGTVSGTSIFTVPARDPDGQVLSYTITAGNAAGKFSIDSSGQLRTAGSLDREFTPTYGLTVTVRDTTTPLPLSATTTVSVILTDVNDNSPVFPNQYQFIVLENQPAGISVGTVTATDADQPGTVNSELTYSLKLASNFFAINPSTGQITTLQTLDYESQSQYIFEVLAVDRASDSRTGTVSVTVFVTDVQDSVPLFTQQIFTASVAEGNANAYVVFVSAVDADAVDNIQYRILSPATATFNINSASGQINTAVALDYETQKYYEFFVTTVDGQGSTNPSSTATVRVTVLDQNDNSPILSLPVASVQVFEDAEVNRVLVTVSATDADAANTTNSEIRFLIVSVTPTSGSSFFSIDRDYGQLVIERSLTNDPGVNQYQIIIHASDRGTPVLSSQATFTVNVIRNTAPLFNPSSITVSINHSIPTATTVSSIQAVDTDLGDYGRLNYLLLGDSIASHYFQLVPAGNGVNIITIDQLTKDTSRTYYLTITAKDNAGIVSKTATTTVTGNVNRNLQDPRWLNLPVNLQTTISITENDPLGQAVFTLSAEDLDILSPDNQVEFRLTVNTQAQNYFRIDSIGYNGVISFIRSPVQDRTINQFTLTVSLTDKGVPPRSAGTATVFVNVLRNDQPPVYFNSTYYVQLREDVAISTNVVQVSATDSDTNSNFNQITYRIIGDDTAPNFFTIVSSGGMAGQITTSGNLASDSTDPFRIRVEATDNGAFPRKATALVFVKVLRNFNSPLWPLNQLFGSVTIPENQNVDSVIYTLPLATDRDSTSPNNITNYRLTSSTPSQGQNYYQVNAATGEVTIKKDLTRDPGVTPYRLTFQAYDLGTPSLTGTQTFTLTVNVYRNTAPVFSPSIYNTMVGETRNVNSNILTLSATDSDAVSIPGGLFSQLTYRIASPASALPYFSVLVDNGQVVLRIVSLLTNAPLDKYLLIVQVTDDGGLSNYAEVTVDIRRNLNAPQFTQTSYVVNITEDRAVGSGIGVTVLATDSDLRSPYRDVTYFETGQPVSLPYFDVNPSSGEVTVARPLSDGTASQYIYTISARDGGNLQPTNFVIVTINVFRNLNPPVIINLPDRRPVAKTTNLGVVIFTVQATDADTVVPFNTLSYSLVAGDMSAFSINGNGDISVATNLTAYGKTELQVVAQVCDGGTNRRCDSEILTVVVDSNLNEPVFVRPGALDGFRAIVTVRENIDSTYTVYDVDATDADTSSPFNDLTYTLTGLGIGPTYFGISPTDGRITIRLSLLQDTAIQYNLTVIVRDGGSPPRQAAQTGTIVVNVIRNNNAPQWQNLPQTQIITQSSGINNIVYTANAIDSDQEFSFVTYSIAGVGTAPSFFTINPNTGIVTLTGDIRTVSDTTFYLLIRASDNGTPPKSTNSVLTILVQRNEFSPNFIPNSEVFSLRIPEMQTIGVAISQVNATDQDNLAPYNTVEYYVIGDTLASIHFNVNSTSGEIFVKFPLQSDSANTQTYTLIIQARDGGSPSRISVDTARVTIEVYRNLNAPRFTLADYITSIPETTPVGTSIFLLTFFDADTDAPFNMTTLTAIGDGLGSSLFHVDNTGRVTTNRNLTLEVANTYQLRVQVQDGGSPSKSGTTVLTIQVQRNLLAPVFVPALYNTTIPENRDTGDIILTVTAIDADTKPPNNIVRYSISSSTSSDIGRQYFMIDEATGGISLKKSAMSDTNRDTLYTFTVVASDSGTPTQTSDIVANVVINVDRNLFAPEFQNEQTYNVQVPFTTGSNVEVNNRILATDIDSRAPFNTVTYSVIGDGNATNFFSINPTLGTITTRTSLVTTNSNTYTIRIVAFDGGTPPLSDTATAMVSINHNLNDPAWSQVAYSVVIQETRVYGDIILTLAASDSDTSAPYNTLQYTMTGEADTNNYFGVDSAGRIFMKQSLLNSVKNTYIAFISLQDGGSPPRSAITQANVTITIVRNNYAPVITNTVFVATLQLNFGVGTQVYTVTAQDQDPANTPFGTVRFRIIGDDDAVRLFSIDSVSGLITIARDLSTANTTADQFRIRVEAYDLGSPSKSDSKVVVVTVRSNFNTPSILPNSYIQTIYETRDLGDVILDINATDADPLAPNNVLDYKITGDASSQQCFQINQKTGEISLKLSLLFQPCRNDSYAMTVVVSDQGVPVLSSPPATVRINVIRNRSPPTFINLDNVTSISETQPINVNIFQAIATDPDQPPFNQITYTAIGDDLSTTIFSVNPSTGAVQLTRSVLNELATQYTLRIEARDSGAIPLSTSAKLVINISRNLNRPVFAQLNYNTTILETQGVGLSFFQISASDADTKAPYNTITFRSVSGATNYFDVVSVGNNGQLIVTRSLTLDTLRTPQYTLQVSVTDGGGLTSQQFAIITINVLRNLNCPVFSTLPTDISISQSVGSRQLYDVNATDDDALGTVFSDITYTLIGDDQAPTYFSMDRLTGVVTSSPALFSHNGVSYTLRFAAADNGSPPCITSSTLTIRVNRNLNSPVWQNAVNNVFTTRIREDLDLSFAVITVQASDADDRSPYNVVRYSLDASSLYQSLFYVDAVTGQVFLRASLVGRSETSYTLKLLATDMGTPALSSPIADLVINVDRNNFPPEILNLPDTMTVSENLFIGTQVIQIQARDNDNVNPYNTYSYYLLGDDLAPTYFTISSTGAITAIRALTTDPSLYSFQLRVQVRDGGNPSKSDTEILKIIVSRNLNNPVMAAGPYRETILETQPLGVRILTASASDSDRNPPNNLVMYIISSNDTVVNQFVTVDSSSGDVKLQKSMLNYPNSATIFDVLFQVNARDNGSPARTALNPQNVTLTVIRNTAPFFTGSVLYFTSIPQTTPGGASVFQTQLVDSDTRQPFNTLTLSIEGDDTAPNFFSISQSGLVSLRVGVNLTFDTDVTSFNVRVKVADGGTPPLSATATIPITIQRNLFTPQFVHGNLNLQIPEAFATGSTVTQLTATDNDVKIPNNIIRYEATSMNNALNYFFLNPTTGLITLLKPVLGIGQDFFSMLVTAADQGIPSRTTVIDVTIQIIRVNGTLTFTTDLYNVVVSESKDIGFFLINMLASPGPNVQYSLVGYSSGPDYFQVNSVSGDITISKKLTTDPARLLNYVLYVKAIISVMPVQSATATVNITVLRNEYGPVFEDLPYTSSWEETIELGTLVETITVTDQDNDTITYRITSGEPYTSIFFLNSQTGEIRLNKRLTNYTGSFFQFNVSASDGQQIATASVIVNVRRDNQNPYFLNAPYSAVIDEVQNESSLVPSVPSIQARDDDLRGQIVYEIDGYGSARTFFTINRNSGQVSVVNSDLLRFDPSLTYVVHLVAYDSVYPNNKAFANLTVSLSRNLHAPVFIGGPYAQTIYDTFALGQEILHLNATDADGFQDTLIYSITGDARAQQFYYINPSNGIIILRKLLTEGTQLSDRVILQVCDQRLQQKCGQTYANITVMRNQFSPVFQGMPYVTTASRAATPGTFIYDTDAFDPDLRGEIRYMIDGIYPVQSFFIINETNGVISLTRNLNLDSLQTELYQIRVFAYDTIYPNDRATATINVTVKRNPNTPRFDPLSYQVTVADSIELGTLIVDVNATDNDGDILTYSTEGSNVDPEDTRLFFIDRQTGIISLKELLTTTSSSDFTFTVVARDPIGTVATASVRVLVTRDVPPIFTNLPTTRNILNSATTAQLQFRAIATDNYPTGQIVYGIAGNLRAPFYFAINNSTGEVSIINSLVPDIVDQYQIAITAYDIGAPRLVSTATLTVSVNKNPNAPVFSTPNYIATIWDYQPRGMVILDVEATDADTDILRYEFMDPPTSKALEYFLIDMDTGKIYLYKNLQDDINRTAEFRMTVQVTDQRLQSKTAQASVTIRILRDSIQPRFTSLPYNRRISENSNLQMSVFTVSAEDTDLQGEIRYRVVGDGSAPYFFRLDEIRGYIDLQRSLNISERNIFTYQFRVQAYDTVYPSNTGEAVVTINIDRNLNGPIFSQPQYSVTIDEETALGKSIGRVIASDADLPDKVTYAAAGDTEALKYFNIGSISGDVFIVQSLLNDTTRRTQHTLLIQASDNFNSPARVTPVQMTITVTRDLFMTQFNNSEYRQTISENVYLSQSIVTIDAIDNDLRASDISFNIIGDYPGPNFFGLRRVGPGRMEVYLTRSLATDGDLNNLYTLRVEAFDATRPNNRATALVIINVLRNPGVPVWTLGQFRANVREDHPVGNSVMRVSATDTDGNNITYNLLSETQQRDLSSGPSDFFWIDTKTGDTVLRRSLLNTNIVQFTLQVQACDSGRPQKCITTDVILSVIKGRPAPTFVPASNYQQTIDEILPVGSFILRLNAVDSDLLGAIRFDFVSPASAFFNLDSVSGNITLAQSIRQLLDLSYSFQVVTYDSGEPLYRSTGVVTITVNRNPNAPQFLQDPYYVPSLRQNTLPGDVIVNTTAVDLDGDVIKYSLRGDTSILFYFMIEEDVGVIFLRRRLENLPRLDMNFQVVAVDQRLVNEKTGVATVNVMIKQDAAPYFVNDPYPDTILAETAKRGDNVIQTSAQDPDNDGQLVYNVVGDFPATNYFTINGSTGLVTVLQDIKNDPAQTSVYKLVLEVYNILYPNTRDTTNITIRINRNPGTPNFIPSSSYRININESVRIGSVIVLLTATDSDGDPVRYRYLSSVPVGAEDYFILATDTGVITTRSVLTAAPQNNYLLRIEASDGRGNTAIATVDITILRNPMDQSPYFLGQNYSVIIPYTSAVGSSILTIQARDNDLLSFITYEAVGVFPALDFFVVNSSTGEIRVKVNLANDALKTLTYTLRIEAYDSARPNNRAAVNVQIYVVRNPNSPVFSAASGVQYNARINETVPVGSSVIRVQASDADNDTLRYSIVQDTGGNIALTYFFLDGVSGVIYVATDLTASRSIGNIFTFTVQARDQGTPEKYGFATVIINIDRDSGAPAFTVSNYETRITETSPVNGSALLTVTAIDSDLKGQIAYEAIGDGLAMTYFGVDRNTGAIYVRKSLLTSTDTRYVLQVKAYDTFFPNNFAVANVVLNVERNPSAPRFLQPNYAAQVNEFESVGVAILRISAVDADGDAVSYRIVEPPLALEYFYIDAYTGDVAIRKSLSLNRVDSIYNFFVEANDMRINNRQTTNATVNIQVVRNANPVFTNLPFTWDITESQAIGQVFFTVSARDNDILGQLSYRLLGDGAALSYFQINETTGAISSRVNLMTDTDNQLNYNIRVGVFDTSVPSRVTEGVLSVRVLRNPNSPVFIGGPYNTQILWNHTLGSLVFDFNASDLDGDKLTYSLASNNVPAINSYFLLNPATGELTLKKPLTDDASINQFIINVLVSDKRNPEKTDTSQLTITVVRDSFAPVFTPTLYPVTVQETRAVISTIETVRATDGDLMGTLVYEAIGFYPAQSFFAVDRFTGAIKIIQDLKTDGSARTSYTLRVVSYDTAHPETRSTADVVITVQRNINSPQFTSQSYFKQVSELYSLGISVITVNAADNDGDAITYQLIKDNRGGASLDFFYIEINTGNIYLRRPLTETSTTEFEFTVSATDSGRPPKEADVTVTITVARLPTPVFVQPFSTTIREDVANNTFVLSVNAVLQGATPGGQIVYEAIGQSPAPYYFFINRQNGDVFVQRDLHTDRTMTYTLTVKAYDTATPSKFTTQDISITVLRNVNSPQFDRRTYNINISDDDPLGRLVVSLNATDKDPGVLVYTLTGDQRCQQVFYLISSTNSGGNLYLGTNLLSTTDANFNCEVTVTDNGYPTPNIDRAQVVVRVARIQPPVFNLASFSAETNENAIVNTTLVRVQASKTQIMGRIAYRTEGLYPAETFFLVDDLTGEVRIRQDLRADSLGLTIYTLRVVAYDTAKPLVTGTALVNITVKRNLNSPVIRPSTVTLTVQENTDITFWGYRVNVTDPDSKNLTCSIIGNAKAQEYFRIEPDSCLIKMKNSLLNDPDKTTEYRIQVQVSDDGMPPNTVTGDVIITVPRDRFNPGFTNLPDTKTIDETLAVGSTVYNIGANDGDLRGKLVYQLDGYLPAETFFAINSTTGVIKVRNSPNSDVLKRGSYTLRVCVYDDAWPSNRVCSNLTVVVNRNPNGPQFSQRSYNANIRASFPPGNIVIQMTAQDFDGDKLKFTSEASAPIQNIFYVNPESSSVMLIENLMNITTIQVYQFNVSVTDGRSTNPKTDRVTVTVSVTPLQGPPVFSNSSVEITIPLTQSNGSIVYTLSAQDPDRQGFIQYKRIGFPLGQEYFAVNLNTGAVTLKKALTLNPDKFPSYVLFIESFDSAEPNDKSYMTLIIRVNRNLYAPEFRPTSSYTASIKDYDPVGTSVIQVSAQDLDITEPENNVIYRIDVGRAGGNEYFRIDSNTSLITINNQLYQDTARPTQYTLYVLASDPSYNPKTATATIIVTVERNVAPTFNPNTYSISVSEATPLFSPIITVFATDANPMNSLNGQLVFSIIDSAARNVWQIDEQNGTLSPRVGLGDIIQEIWEFTVQVNDKGIPSMFDRASVRLTITEVLPWSQPGETCKTENDTRGTEWSRTLQDTYDKKPCPTEMSGEAVRYCLHGGVWSNPSYDNCIKNTLLDLQKLIDKIKNGLAPNIVPDALVNLTGLTNPNTVELNKAEVQVVSNILNDVIQISNNTNITNNDVENFLEIASNLIDVKNSPAWQALIIDGKEGATTVLQNVEEYNRIKAKSINLADEPVKRFTRKNLFVEIGYNPVSDIQFPNTTANGLAFINGSSLRFVLSRDALNNGYYTSYSCAYFNNVSGIIQRYVLQNGSKTSTGADLQINSAVLSLQLDPPPPPLLSPPLILTFKHFSANYSKPVCSYWVFIAPGSENGAWSSNGCKVVSTSDYTTVCECNHLTNFAILMSPGKTPDKDQVPLSIISIIGCAISIFCLSVTMIAHFIVWRYVKSDRTSLLMNLCLALIISYIIFLAGVDRTENKGVCIAVAALLHYFYLAVFFLMLTYGIELAVSMIYVFVTRSRIQWLLPLAWSLPAVVVAISLGVTKLEGYGNEKFCWLSIKDGLIWAFVGPAALVTLVNFIIIIVVFKHMFSSFTMMTKSDKDKAKTAVQSLCVLLPITGITWVFGILSVNEDLVVFQYLFAIINSLQGLFISLFHCFFNHNLRQAIKQINAKRKRSLVTYSTTPKISSNSSGQSKDREERHEMIRAVPVNQEDQMIITRWYNSPQAKGHSGFHYDKK